jgi:hypothetical protein
MNWSIGFITATLSFGLFPGESSAAGSDAESIRLGKQLYHEGLLSDGKPSEAIVQGDVVVSGMQFTCVSCHQRSGMGSSEGGKQTPAVKGSVLFAPIEIRRRELHGVKIIRPAYDMETLKMAISNGVDAAGNTLDPLMPRYPLPAKELNNLIAYLNSFNSAADPGVTQDTIHFATIVAGPVDEDTLTAVQNITNRYVADKNALTRQEDKRAANAPWIKDWHYESYRKWKFHTWTLTGEPSSWSDQLRQAYEEQPVFAVIGGLGEGEWDPIDAFCNDMHLPCILPTTLLAPDQAPGFYTLYFNAGIDLEARVLAKHIESSEAASDSCTTLQVHDNSVVSLRAVTALKQAFFRADRDIETRSIGNQKGIADFDWRTALSQTAACSLVLWLPGDMLGDLSLLRKFPHLTIYMSASLAAEALASLPASEEQKIRLIYPYQVQTRSRKSPRLTAWARGKHIELTHKNFQANTFYALSMAADAMLHIRGHYLRDYFLEKIEHMATRMLVKPAYDGLSLAPGQRFLSKGAYIVKPPSSPEGPVVPVSDWIVP